MELRFKSNALISAPCNGQGVPTLPGKKSDDDDDDLTKMIIIYWMFTLCQILSRALFYVTLTTLLSEKLFPF